MSLSGPGVNLRDPAGRPGDDQARPGDEARVTGSPVYGQLILLSAVDGAPAPTCTEQLVAPTVIVALLTLMV